MTNELNVIDLVDGNAWESGADGYIIKAGQGQLEYNWRDLAQYAVLEGKPYGLYWLVDARYSPESHKAAIKAAFPTGDFGALGLWLDIEKPVMNMTDQQYNALPYHGYQTVESVWRGVQAYTGKYPGMYFGPASWDLIMAASPMALQMEFAAGCECWIAHYGVDDPSMRGMWNTWAMHQWRAEPDYNHVDLNWWFDVQGSTPVFIMQKLSEVDICLTPSTKSTLPLKTPLQQALDNGWQTSINCGAGFTYVEDDPRAAVVKGYSKANGIVYSDNGDWGHLDPNPLTSIPFARRMIDQGAINPDLDSSYLAPWSCIGFDGVHVWLFVTRGQEGAFGFTQKQAAEWARSRGITECYLFDSGHSSGLAHNGKVLYSAYNEAIPQCAGLRIKTISGGSMKGVTNTGKIANVKSELTGAILHQMTAGEYVYGEWSSSQHTDLWHFDHYYTATGTKIGLAVMCKVSVGNLTVTAESEPTTPPPDPGGGNAVPHIRVDFTAEDGKPWFIDDDMKPA